MKKIISIIIFIININVQETRVIVSWIIIIIYIM